MPRAYMTTFISISPDHTSPHQPIPHEPPTLYNLHALANLPQNHPPHSRHASHSRRQNSYRTAYVQDHVEDQYNTSTITSRYQYNANTGLGQHQHTTTTTIASSALNKSNPYPKTAPSTNIAPVGHQGKTWSAQDNTTLSLTLSFKQGLTDLMATDVAKVLGSGGCIIALPGQCFCLSTCVPTARLA